MKQTAVDWLVDQVENFNCMKLGLIPSNIIEKAKQMEKQQIEEAFIKGEENIDQYGCYENPNLSEQYYKETYRSNEP